MPNFNLFKAKAPKDKSDPEGYRAGMARFGNRIGARLIVLQGRPTLRRPRGTQKLEPGDVVCFPPGPEGAHKVTNRTQETVRVLMVSTKNEPSVAVYPDSDKMGVWPGGKESLMFQRAGGKVGYWEGETS